jgi:hypothetical protein
VVRFAVGMYKSKVCLVLIVCTCELDINWPLFLVTNKNIESIYWNWTCRIFNSLNSCRQEVFLPEFIIILIILFWILNMSSLFRKRQCCRICWFQTSLYRGSNWTFHPQYPSVLCSPPAAGQYLVGWTLSQPPESFGLKWNQRASRGCKYCI